MEGMGYLRLAFIGSHIIFSNIYYVKEQRVLKLPSVTRAEATAIPVQPFGAKGLPPVGKRTIRDRTAPLFPLQGSRAIGLGRDR